MSINPSCQRVKFVPSNLVRCPISLRGLEAILYFTNMNVNWAHNLLRINNEKQYVAGVLLYSTHNGTTFICIGFTMRQNSVRGNRHLAVQTEGIQVLFNISNVLN
jgi:hypothetical protein